MKMLNNLPDDTELQSGMAGTQVRKQLPLPLLLSKEVREAPAPPCHVLLVSVVLQSPRGLPGCGWL